MRLLAFAAVIAISLITTPDIFSPLSLRSMLVVGSFLGIASVGQTVCVLLGGIDLSVPYLIGVADLGTLWLIDKGLPSQTAVCICIALCGMAGVANGYLSHLLPGQSIVVTLGIGYLCLGGINALASIGSSSAGAVFGKVPQWISWLPSLKARFLGLPIAPAGVLWLIVCVLMVIWLRRRWLGRGIYAVGGNPLAASRMLVSGRRTWIVTFMISGLLSGVVGVLLLGYSGGAVSDAGMPYLFLTVAAVVVGGNSLVGGRGGIGLTVVGVIILTLLNVVLLGTHMSDSMQQVILGLIIVPAVAAYGRAAHPRMRL